MMSILLFRQLFLDEFRRKHSSQWKRSSPQEVEFYQRQLQATWRHKMLLRFFIICCFFPIVYVAIAMGWISADMGIAGFLVGSLLGKLLFSTYLAQCYSELYTDIELNRTAEQVEEATRRKFLRFVFHELRSPLNSLSMGVQMLSDSLLDQAMYALSEDDSQILKTVQRSTKMLTDHVDQVLSLHRAQAGELTATFVPFHLNQWANDIHTFAASALHTIGGHVKMTVSRNLPKVVEGDAERTELMMQSLLSYLALHLKSLGNVDIIISEKAPLDLNARIVRSDTSTTQDLLPNETTWRTNSFRLGLKFITRIIVYTIDLLFFSNFLACKMHQGHDKTNSQEMADLYVLVQSDDFTLSATEMAEQLLKPYAEGKLRTNIATEELQSQLEQDAHSASEFDLSLAAEILGFLSMGDISVLQAKVMVDGQHLSLGVCLHLRVGVSGGIMFPSPLSLPEERSELQESPTIVETSKIIDADDISKAAEVEEEQDEETPVIFHSVMSSEFVPTVINTHLSTSLGEFVEKPSPHSNASPASVHNSNVSHKEYLNAEQPPVVLVAPAPLIRLRALVVDGKYFNLIVCGAN